MVIEALAMTLREVGIALGIFFGVPTLLVIAWAVVRYRQSRREEEAQYRLRQMNRAEPVDFAAELRALDRIHREPTIVRTASGERLPL